MPPPSETRIRELVQNHWGPLSPEAIRVPNTCSLSADVCADALSILLARGYAVDQLAELCANLFDGCTTTADLLSRACTELYTLAGCDAVASAKIAAELGFQATDSRPALAFCLQSVCVAIDESLASATGALK
jgi:hypothetical protein